MRLLILWIHWRNTKQKVPHLLTTEMRRDNVEPTRIAMYRWTQKKGYVAGKPIDPLLLKSHLLTTYTASIRRNGLILHRPNKGGSVELLSKAVFNDSYLATSGLIRAALNGGSKHIEVKVNSDDLSQIYLFDKNGVHVIKNTSNDPLLVHEGCLADISVMNDVDRELNIETASQQDQDAVDMRSTRDEEQASAIHKKKLAQSMANAGPKPKTDRSSVRANQAEEERVQMDDAAKRASGEITQKITYEVLSSSNNSPSKAMAAGHTAGNDINADMRERLKNFHDQRKALGVTDETK